MGVSCVRACVCVSMHLVLLDARQIPAEAQTDLTTLPVLQEKNSYAKHTNVFGTTTAHFLLHKHSRILNRMCDWTAVGSKEGNFSHRGLQGRVETPHGLTPQGHEDGEENSGRIVEEVRRSGRAAGRAEAPEVT